MNCGYVYRFYDPANWRGSFQWDDTGSIITIDIIDAPTHYLVVQDKLIRLDENGKPMSGKLAGNYVLKKEY